MTRDGRPLLQSGFNPDHVTANPLVGERLRLSWPAGRRRLLLTQWDSNHFHWMFDSLPRLALLPDNRGAPLLVPAELGEAQLTSLRLTGVPDDELDPFHGYPVRVRELEFPSLVGRTGHPPRWVLDWLRERLVPATARRGRRLFVSRRDTTSRRLANEDEVFAALELLGFELILPGQLPLTEQLRAFAEASMVVGPHGAGLVSLFAATDAIVIELFDPRYVNGCYYAVAEALKCPYWFVTGDPAGDDFTVEPRAVRATVEAAAG
jgi:capsular polysaccharide biosynthesis protein